MNQLTNLWRSVGAVFGLVTIIQLGATTNTAAQEEKLSGDLLRAMDTTSGPIPILAIMRPVALHPISTFDEVTQEDIEISIKQSVLSEQAEMRELVNGLLGEASFGGERPIQKVKFFWISNALMATASQETIMELASRDEVRAVYLDRQIKLAPDFREEVDADSNEYTYGLEKIRVPELRSAHPELIGTGVTVGILDTGIDAEHPDLKGKVVAFKDFVQNKEKAYDDHGHGTHCAGTIAGGNASGTYIGVAPGAKLVIGKILSGSGSGSVSGILRGMEWIADPDGNPQTPDAPRVVSNSWGGSKPQNLKDDPFNQPIFTWIQLNIVPSFAAGNSGPRASTVGSPGGLPEAFGVGATDANDEAANFSSRGPAKWVDGGAAKDYNKPDISAPGVDVISAAPGGKYQKMSGTSMATPHTSGALALIIQANPKLKVQQIKEAMMKSAQDLGQPGLDNTFGAGRVDVLKAAELAMSMDESR